MDNRPEHGFADVVQATSCLFARSARIEHGPQWQPHQSFKANVDRNAQALETFADRIERDRLHGFVIEISAGEAAADFHVVTEVFGRVMSGLAGRDPHQAHCMTRDIEDPQWQFEFSGLRMFTSVFAPCYDRTHTKFSATPGMVFVFFQPEISFDFCNVNPHSQHTRDRIRQLFRSAGRPYDEELIDRRIEAHIYLSPQRIGDAPVRWWEA